MKEIIVSNEKNIKRWGKGRRPVVMNASATASSSHMAQGYIADVAHCLSHLHLLILLAHPAPLVL